MYLAPLVLAAIRAHAEACYPNEACGLIVAGSYLACDNTHPEPRAAFRIDPHLAKNHEIEAVIHSHTGAYDAEGRFLDHYALHEPSSADIVQQNAMDVPWGLVACFPRHPKEPPKADNPWFWGDSLPMAPLFGRGFRHGPSGTDNRGDCYALIRDMYRLGPASMEQTQVPGWTQPPVLLMEGPRDQNWWAKGENLYDAYYARAGFERIYLRREEAAKLKAGDVLLWPLLSSVVNHGAVYLGHGLIIHHKAGRLSGKEPLMKWWPEVSHILRYRQ